MIQLANTKSVIYDMDWVSLHLGPLAQSVEQQTFNLWVVGSIPTGPTIILIPSPIHPY